VEEKEISKQCKFEFKSHVDRIQKREKVSRNKAIALLADAIGMIRETGRTLDKRARKKLGQIEPKNSKTPETQGDTPPPLTASGGAREGAGRPKRAVRNDCYCGVCNEEFKDSYPLWHCAVCFKHLAMDVSECPFCRKDVRPDDRKAHTVVIEKPEPPEEETPTVADAYPGAIELAERAIAVLTQITLDDPKRVNAFMKVSEWMDDNL